MNTGLNKTLKLQRNILEIEPIHAKLSPVQEYVKYISKLKGEPFSVVTIPSGTAAYEMGYRFVSIPNTELEHYINNGSTLEDSNK